jgi:serine/threonine-protein kinase haspin
VKASHLRQARFRKGTPFRRIPRISLASTLTLSPISPLSFARNTKADTEIRSTKGNRPTHQPLLPPSSPLTWDESLTPEAVRVLDLTSDDEEQSSVIAIERLLKFAGQAAPVEFATFLETFRTQDIDGISLVGNREKARSVQRSSLKYRKIGDASYSEVFAIGDLVLKIIPLAVEIDAENSEDSEDDDEDEVPFKSSPESVLKEIVITKATGEVVDGFIKLLRYSNFLCLLHTILIYVVLKNLHCEGQVSTTITQRMG